MTRCKRCLMPDTRPSTHFEDGVCSACLTHDKLQEVDWEARKGDLTMLLDPMHPVPRRNSEFDCIVPSSGGKDSTWQVLTLIEMGVRPLVVTCTTCHLTDMGRRNIENLARYATTIEYTPNRNTRATLNRLGLTLLGDISWPEHVLIHTYPLKLADQMDIPLVFYGENPNAAYGGPPGEDEASEMSQRWAQEFGGYNGMRPMDFIGLDGLTYRDMSDYTCPDVLGRPANETRAYFLGAFLPWDSRRNATHAYNAGFDYPEEGPSPANKWPWENIDNAQTWIHDAFMYAKFGYGRACAQMSVDIRTRNLSRSAGLTALEGFEDAYGEPIEVQRYMGVSLEEMLDRIGMSLAEYRVCLESFTASPAAPPLKNWG